MPVSSPCVQRCVLDDASGQCRGCGRTLAEIAAWGSFTELQRQAVMATLRRRLAGGREPAPPREAGHPAKPDIG